MSVTNYQQVNLKVPNPFTVRPITTPFKTNELLLDDHIMRITARTAIQDIGLIESSTYISPMHLQPGWKWM